jgi:DNA helicase-2/ATP-dependent DNA helicase PcrA
MRSNIRLVTNVICVESDDNKLRAKDIMSRLGYFELLTYSRSNPVLFSLAHHQFTYRQVSERDGPLGRNGPGLTKLWNHLPEMKPMQATREANPFNLGSFKSINDIATNRPPAELFHWEQTALGNITHEQPDDPEIEQKAVIEADEGFDMLVVAPPGTGKTHVLVERIAHLVESGKSENPLADILVLSFTRSAVAELRKRLIAKVDAGGDERMLYARIRTFDSLATYLLKLDLAPEALADGYSQRIEQLTLGFQEGGLPSAEEDISKVKFLFVDEVQDLNGFRAEMVLALARRVSEGGGCSIFLGDPAQAIYDFSGEANQNSITSLEFLGKLLSGDYCGKQPKRIEFSQYRRFETPEIRSFVCSARSAMGEDGLSADGAQLDELLRSLGARSSLEELTDLMKKPGRKALLTRNNLEAYWLWEYCRKTGISAQLWRGSSGNFWPGWIGRLTLGFQNEVMSLSKAAERWRSLVAPYVNISFSEAVEFLRDQGVLDSDAEQIRISELNQLISNGAPLSYNEILENVLVISTIHRSKGLEFENVFLYSPKDNALGDAEEVRIVYVAATRAKRSLRLLTRSSSIVRFGQKNGKWFSTSEFHIFKYPSMPKVGLLVDGADVVCPDSMLSSSAPLEDLKFLWEKCAGIPRGAIVEDGKLICENRFVGELGKTVQKDLKTIRSFRKTSDIPLNGLVINDLATVAFDLDNPLARQSVGVACLGLVPVVSGIVSI